MNARFAPVLLVLLLPPIANAASIDSLTLTDLGAGVVPNAINNFGQVVGKDASGHAFLWQSGITTPLGTLGGSQSSANDVNDSGEVVGSSYLSDGRLHAFNWTPGATMVDLTPQNLRNFNSVAQAVNSNGTVVGWWARGTIPGFCGWDADGTVMPISFSFSGNYNKATGINDTGEMVGALTDSSGNPISGYYASSASATGISDLVSFCPMAGINNNSIAAGFDGNVGAYWSPTGGLGHTGLLSPSDPSSVVNGLNDNGLLVGTSGGKAFLFDTGASQIYDLSAYVLPGSPFSQLTAASDINNTNEFVGVGLVDGVEHGFVAQILVPEPGTWAMLAAVAVAIGCLLARKRWFHLRAAVANESYDERNGITVADVFTRP